MRRVFWFFTVLLLCLLPAGSAWAATAEPSGRDLVVLSGDAVVPRAKRSAPLSRSMEGSRSTGA